MRSVTTVSPRSSVRLMATVLIALTLVVGAFVMNAGGPEKAGAADELKKSYDATAAGTTAQDDDTVYNADGTHAHDPGAPAHDDNDPATKNAISRAATSTDGDTADPTTPAQAEAHARSAAAQRTQPAPPQRTVPVDPAQPTVPTSSYNLFNACYGLKGPNNRWFKTDGFSATSLADSTPFYFKPTALGRYLLYTKDGKFLGHTGGGTTYVDTPGPAVDWKVARVGTGRFQLKLADVGYLTAVSGGPATFAGGVNSASTEITPVRRGGCTAFPEIKTGVVGDPTAGVTPFQETRGYLDAHTHGMAFEFLGGKVHCGRPWSPWGVAEALTDCQDHTVTAGYGALMEAFLSGKPSHDPVGWPTFKDWPAPDSLTHEGTYYKWMERSWRGGQRLLVNLLVENNQLCMLYPLKRNSCDDMDSIRLQAKDMRLLQNYIDAQHGGPGKGWYRIVRTPAEARQVINAGKMAVVMGIETSVLFGCHQFLGRASCTKASIDAQLDEVQKLGVVQMELVNKFDNALAGVAGDEGTTGYLVNAANILETGSAWRMTTCNPNGTEVHDKNQDPTAPVPSQDALFGALLQVLPLNVLSLLPQVPLLYGPPNHCNKLGLTELGAYTIRGMVKRSMIFDPDHMSVKARQQSLDLIDELGYGGVVSSHSWSTPDAYPRIYDEKGFIAPYAGDSTGFVEKWKRLQTWANPSIYWGIGFGADINGLGAQGSPRGADAEDKVTYPFTGLGGVTIHQQQSGSRVYDINVDGVAHYGLYPDWVQDLKKQAGQDIVEDLARGSEAYLQMWERAYGVASDSCAAGATRHSKAWFASNVKAGQDWWTVVKNAGQPHRRIQNTFTYCATNGTVAVSFKSTGKVLAVS